MKNKVPRGGQNVVKFLTEKIAFQWYLFSFAMAVVMFGVAYAALTPCGHGLASSQTSSQTLSQPSTEPSTQPSSKPSSQPSLKDATFLQTFWLGQYFSVCAISTLGCGDLYVVGASRVLACIEVLFGLMVMGVMIARITSRQMSYHVKRLFSSDAQNRLENYTEQFMRVRAALWDMMQQLSQPTPGVTQLNTAANLRNLRETVHELKTRSTAFATYIAGEVGESDYLAIAPVDAVRRVGEAVDATFFVLSQLLIGLPPEVRMSVLDDELRRHIFDAVSAQQLLSDTVQKRCRDQQTTACFARLLQTCSLVAQSYFLVPGAPQAPAGPPDQLPPTAPTIANPSSVSSTTTSGVAEEERHNA